VNRVVSEQENVPNALKYRYSHKPAASTTAVIPKMPFHSPVGASISLNVWRKLARYRAFFSSIDNFFQSPFSFSLSAWGKHSNLIIRATIRERALTPLSSSYHDIRSVFLPAYRRTGKIRSVQVDGIAIVSEADHIPVADPVHCHQSTSLDLNDRSQATRKQSTCHCSLQKYSGKWMNFEVPTFKTIIQRVMSFFFF